MISILVCSLDLCLPQVYLISTSGGSLDFCTLQVYANGTYKLYSDYCPPQVYATSLHSQDFCSVQYRYMLSACSGVNYATIPPVCGYVVDNFHYPSNDCGRNVNAFFSDINETYSKDSIHAKLLAYQF